ncbi:hypothetical protein STREPTOSP366_62980, partial [Streptomyces variabilis]
MVRRRRARLPPRTGGGPGPAPVPAPARPPHP